MNTPYPTPHYRRHMSPMPPVRNPYPIPSTRNIKIKRLSKNIPNAVPLTISSSTGPSSPNIDPLLIPALVGVAAPLSVGVAALLPPPPHLPKNPLLGVDGAGVAVVGVAGAVAAGICLLEFIEREDMLVFRV